MGLLVRLAMGWNAPRQPVLGTECSGVVEAVGAEVTRFGAGDAVVAVTGISMGAHAEYVCVHEDGPVAAKPEALSWGESAALFFGGTTALHYLRDKAHVRPGERVLVIGASGAVGVAAVQLARREGAEVTAVCSVGLLRVVCGLGGQLAALWQGRLSGHRVIAGVAAERPDDVRLLAELAREGVVRAVIDTSMPLSRVAEAHARVGSGRKRGSVVVTLAGDP